MLTEINELLNEQKYSLNRRLHVDIPLPRSGWQRRLNVDHPGGQLLHGVNALSADRDLL